MNNTPNKAKRSLWDATVLELATILAIITIFGCADSVPFNKEKWDKRVGRQAMATDIARNVVSPGTMEEDVLEILGNPDERLAASAVSNPHPNASAYLYYDLELSDEAFDVTRFVVVIDNSGKVMKSFVYNN